jgi:hypothetical protein
MKKRMRILLVSAAILLFLILAVTFCCAQYNVYELTPTICNFMLGSDVTPQSFVANQGQGTTIEFEYTYAKVNADGNLMLILSDSERDAWKNEMVMLQILSRKWRDKKDIGVDIIEQEESIQTLIIEPGLSCGLELSEDYKTVIAEPDDDSFYYQWFVIMGVEMQFFDGVPSDEISVEYIKYGADGTIVRHLSWPKDDAIMWPGETDK